MISTDSEETIEVGPVWSGHPVGFALLTAGAMQFVAYYDDECQLTVASRALGSLSWRYVRLPVTTDWDSHRYITLAVDAAGFLHLAANMHNSPLTYFRSKMPYNAESLRAINRMVGAQEQRCTYPRFFMGPRETLAFTYRDGSSGNGAQRFNLYATDSQTWDRVSDGPLIDGEGQQGVYLDRFRPPPRGPDGFYHFCWVWRASSDPVTTHAPSYMRSRDLVSWETSAGEPLALPVTLATAEVIDPVPARGGIINGNICAGIDARGRPIVSYHKFDEQGNSQIYNARPEDGRWRTVQASRWDHRWEFGGGGTIPFEIRVGPVQLGPDGVLTQAWQHARYGAGRWILDDETLEVVGLSADPVFPVARQEARARLLGLVTNHAEDLGGSPGDHARYILQWETSPANRDQRRHEPAFATTLRVHRMDGRPAHLTGYSEVPRS